MSYVHGAQPIGAVAQLGERLVCNQEVTSSNLVGSILLRSESVRSYGWQAS
jgi:hypothetical protein